MRKTLNICLLLLLSSLMAMAGPADYSWDSPSKNSSESMPVGGGDIGMNVWVEDGDLLFYLSKSGAYDENGTLLKQGRIRMKIVGETLTPFRQTLKLNDGYMELQLGGTNVVIWADVYKSVIHVETSSKTSQNIEVAYESWRHADRQFRKNEGRQNSYKWSKPAGLFTFKDAIDIQDDGIRFMHRNKEQTVFDRTVAVQGMDEVKDQLWNPLPRLTSGGRLWSDNLEFVNTTDGKYIDTDYRAWNFRSKKAQKKHTLHVALHVDQTADTAQWQEALDKLVASVNMKKDRKASRTWWNQYWQRSYITSDGTTEEMTRNYTLFRYMLGCNAYGKEPTKFNGGLLTFDPVFVTKTETFTPDFRNWGGGTMTAQNQRLVYWGMLKSGDVDMMKPQFDFYKRMLKNCELRSKFYWGHEGGCFAEQIELFGLPNFMEYGSKRPAGADKGVERNAWLEYEWDTVLEFCQMILQANIYTGQDITEYLPLIESALTFFDQHYQHRATMRGAKKLTSDGKLVLFPGSGCETYKMAYNASSTVAALQTVLKTYIAYKEGLKATLAASSVRDKDVEVTVAPADTASWQWKQMLSRIPDIPYRTLDGKRMIAPAVVWERVNNVETSQLYPVFPWRIFGVHNDDKEGLETALNTYLYDPDALRFREPKGWKQDNIWAACLGQADDALKLTTAKLTGSKHRFPAFWGPDFDWTPDHNRGGSGMIGLHEMLLQTDGKRIILFPAWNKQNNVAFKLHAPYNTTVEAELRNGEVVRLVVTPKEREHDVVVR